MCRYLISKSAARHELISLVINTLQSIEVGQWLYYVDKPDKNGIVTDRNNQSNLNFNFINASQLEFEFSHRYVFLENDFDPTGVNEKNPIKVGGYNTKEIQISYNSTSSKKFRSETTINYGGFYNGEKLSIDTKLNYRVDKLMQASLKLGIDKISENKFFVFTYFFVYLFCHY